MIQTHIATPRVEVAVDIAEGLFDARDALGHQVTVDMGRKLGRPGDQGISPRDLLLAALSGCSGASFLAAMQGRGQTLSRCQIVVSGELDTRPPAVFRKIDFLLRVAGPNVDPEAVREAAHACHGDCSIYATLAHVAEITVRYEIEAEA